MDEAASFFVFPIAIPEPLVIPPCPLGEPVELREYAASDGETYLVEIRLLRGSKKYFPYFLEDLPGWDVEKEDAP